MQTSKLKVHNHWHFQILAAANTISSFAEILAPLTAASDLPNHPGMAPAYTSKAIDEMIANVSEALRREQRTLVKLKKIMANLRGDAEFMPCGAMHTDLDDLLLGGRWLSDPGLRLNQTQLGQDVQAWRQRNGNASSESLANTRDAAPDTTMTTGNVNDTEMVESGNQQLVNGTEQQSDGQFATTSVDGQAGDTELSGAVKTTETDAAEPMAEVLQPDQPQNDAPPPIDDVGSTREGDDEDSTSQPLSHRMTTRAQANKQSEQSSPTVASPNYNEEDVPQVHPFFLFSSAAIPDADFGLPKKEAEEARTFLSLYIAKQEEIVRNCHELQSGLLLAKRKRDNVFRWAKAEGHVGEMSDGEDWYDMEEWGLKDPLKKGEEEPDEEINTVGKKTRQRRTER